MHPSDALTFKMKRDLLDAFSEAVSAAGRGEVSEVVSLEAQFRRMLWPKEGTSQRITIPVRKFSPL